MSLLKKVLLLIMLACGCYPVDTLASDLFELADQLQWQKIIVAIKNGAPINQQDSQGRTVLMKVASLNQPSVLQELVKMSANVNIKDFNGQTALTYAVQSGQYEQVYHLIYAGANSATKAPRDQNLVNQALQWNDSNTALTLIALNVAPLPENKDKLSLLLIEAIERQLTQAANNLVMMDLDFNRQDKSSRTALMVAADKGYLHLVEKLIQAGSSVSESDASGKTALGFAIQASVRKKNQPINLNLQDPLSMLFNDAPLVNFKAVIKTLRLAGAKADDKIISTLLEQEGKRQGFWTYYIRSQLYYWEIILFYLGVVLTMILLFRQFDVWVDIIAVCFAALITGIATIGLAGNHLPEAQYLLTTTKIGNILFAGLRALVITAFALSLLYLIYQLLETTTENHECVILEDDMSCYHCGKAITLDNRNKGFCPYCKKRFNDTITSE